MDLQENLASQTYPKQVPLSCYLCYMPRHHSSRVRLQSNPIDYAVGSMDDDMEAIFLIGLLKDEESDKVIIVKDPLLIENVFYPCIHVAEGWDRHEVYLSGNVRFAGDLSFG